MPRYSNNKLGFGGLIVLSVLPLAIFLFFIFSKGSSVQFIERVDIIRLILPVASGLSSMLLAVVGVLIGIYWSSATPAMQEQLRPLVWWVVGIIFIASCTALLSLCFDLFKVQWLFTPIVASFGSSVYLSVVAIICTTYKIL